MPKWVEFIRDEQVLDASKAVVAEFKAGERHQLSDLSARRWTRRGAAVECEPPARKAKKAKD